MPSGTCCSRELKESLVICQQKSGNGVVVVLGTHCGQV